MVNNPDLGLPATILMPQTLDESGRMDLIGFVIAGQCIHDNIDAETYGHFALLVSAGRHFGQRAAL